MITRRTALAGLATLAAAPLGLARAQEGYPSRIVRAIVPFPAGSATDGLARFVTERLGTALGRNVIVENVAGANGALAARQTAQADPDGHTIMFGTNSTHAMNMYLMRSPGYDALRDFAPIALTSIAPLALMVRSDFPAQTVEQFIAHARANPGQLNYGTGNTGTIIATQLLKSMTGIQAEAVAYRGTPPAVSDLLGGRLQFMVTDFAATMGHIRAGTLRVLAVTPAQRIPTMPDVPTLAEAGVPGYEFASWVAAFAPARTPADILARLNREIVAIVSSEDGQRASQNVGLIARTSTPDELRRFQEQQITLLTRLAQEAGLPPE
jgi:tripartite-type tricarboxylate transporter receptor subunit TctC